MSPSLGVPLTVNLQSQRACSPSEVKVKEIGPAARSCHGYTDRRMYDSYVQQQQHTRSSLAMSRAEQSRAASQISDAAACQVSHCHVLDPTCWIRSCHVALRTCASRGSPDWSVSQSFHLSSAACEKRHSFLSFPYVCPEPVLVK